MQVLNFGAGPVIVTYNNPVMAGLDPAIHAHGPRFVFMGPRVKPEDDGGETAARKRSNGS